MPVQDSLPGWDETCRRLRTFRSCQGQGATALTETSRNGVVVYARPRFLSHARYQKWPSRSSDDGLFHVHDTRLPMVTPPRLLFFRPKSVPGRWPNIFFPISNIHSTLLKQATHVTKTLQSTPRLVNNPKPYEVHCSQYSHQTTRRVSYTLRWWVGGTTKKHIVYFVKNTSIRAAARAFVCVDSE